LAEKAHLFRGGRSQIKVKKHLVKGDVLDVGAGNANQFKWDTLDIDPDVSPDYLHNVEQGLPFQNEPYANVVCLHVLEQVARKRVLTSSQAP